VLVFSLFFHSFILIRSQGIQIRSQNIPHPFCLTICVANYKNYFPLLDEFNIFNDFDF